MTAQGGLPGMVSAAEHEADLRAREDDPTPRGVVRAVLEAALGPRGEIFVGATIDDDGHIVPQLMRSHVKLVSPPTDRIRVVDLCAGWGCWASEARRLAAAQGWPVHITGVELDGRKLEHLRKWCDAVRLHDVQRLVADDEVGRDLSGVDDYDLAIGNPAFSLLAPKPKDGESIEDAARRSIVVHALELAPAVLLLHHTQNMIRGRVGRTVMRWHPPAASWLIPGAVSFRADRKTDSRCYQATLWLRGHSGPCATHLLPELGPEALRWRVPPGTEEPCAELPGGDRGGAS